MDVMLNIEHVRVLKKRKKEKLQQFLVEQEPRNTSIMCYRSDAV